MPVVDLEVTEQELFEAWKTDVRQILGVLQYGVHPNAVRVATLFAQYEIDVDTGGKYEDVAPSGTKYFAGAGAQIVAALADLAAAVVHLEAAADGSDHNVLPNIRERE